MRALLAILLVLLPYLLPGIRVGSVPIPTMFLFCGLYLVAFHPRIPPEYFKAFLIVLGYMLLFCLRNSLLPSGGAREFLYLLMIFGHLSIFVAFYDLFQRGYGELILRLSIVFAVFEVLVMLAQSMDFGGINQSLAPLFLYYLGIANAEDFLLVISSRPFGTMSTSILAGMSAYLAMRAVAVYTGKRAYVYLALPAILLSASRMALVMFIFYEFVIPFLLRSGRLRSLLILAVLGGVLAGVIAVFGDSLMNLYAFQFAQEVGEGKLGESFSLINRLNSYVWAYEKLDQFLLLGGVTTDEFSARPFAVDSEIVLRSLQFGLIGYLLMIWLNFIIVAKSKCYDSYFILFFMFIASITNTVASNFLFMPFVAIYVCALRIATDKRRLQQAISWHLSSQSTPHWRAGPLPPPSPPIFGQTR